MLDKESKKVKIKSWYSNRYQIVVVQRNVLLLITIVSIIAVTISIFFVKSIMASKSLEPYVIEIDEKSGMATVLEQFSSQNFTANEMVQRYFVNKYVQAAVGYSPRSYRQDVEEVRLFSAPSIYRVYRQRIDSATLGPDSSIAVKIKSIILKKDAKIEVRISREFNISGSEAETKEEVIYMTCYFAPEINLTMEERLINPLGFQVSKFEIGEDLNAN